MCAATYLDYNATTPLKPAVLALMIEVLQETGNASSVHSFGRQARKRVETAREQIAALAGTHSNQVTFNSGATEANNTVLCSFAGERILISATEHSSIINTVPQAERIPVTSSGVIDMDAYEAMLRDDSKKPPALISVMMVNNETGVIQPVADIARLAKKIHPDVHIHTDAVQAAGRIKIDFPALQVDYMTLSAHKISGPQGIGALITAPGARPARLICGGTQERHQRAGTENIPAIAAFGLAAELAAADMDDFQALAPLRDELERRLKDISPGLIVFSESAARVANTSAIAHTGLDAQTVLMGLDLAGIAISGGSACASGSVKSGHVLMALRPDDYERFAAFRISLGLETIKNDIDHFIEQWEKLYNRIKSTQGVISA